MNLGDKILLERKKAQLSQDDLAEMVNVSRQSISLWETNQTLPSLDNLLTLSKIFHISLDELCSNQNNNEEQRNINYVRIDSFLEKGDFASANELVERMLLRDDISYKTYLYKILIDNKLKSLEDLRLININLYDDKYFRLAYNLSDGENKKELKFLGDQSKKRFINLNNEKLSNLALLYEKKKSYGKAYRCYKLLNKEDEGTRCLQLALDEVEFLEASNIKRNLLKAKSIIKEFDDNQELSLKAKEIDHKLNHIRKNRNIICAISICTGVILCSTGSVIGYFVYQDSKVNICIDYLNEKSFSKARAAIEDVPGNDKKSFLYELLYVFEELAEDKPQYAIERALDNNIKVIGKMDNTNYTSTVFEYNIKTPTDLPKPEDIKGYIFSEWRLYDFNFLNDCLYLNYSGSYRPYIYRINYVHSQGYLLSNVVTEYSIITEPFELPKVTGGPIFIGWNDGEGHIITHFTPKNYLKDMKLTAAFAM